MASLEGRNVCHSSNTTGHYWENIDRPRGSWEDCSGNCFTCPGNSSEDTLHLLPDWPQRVLSVYLRQPYLN